MADDRGMIVAAEPDAGWALLAKANERLASARSIDQIVNALRDTARAIVGAEGIAVIVREGDCCFYAAEDAESALWNGRRFPVDHCVSGWAMLNRETVVIPDVALDGRVPQEAYAETFVRSLVMAPIGLPEPIAAIGAYWSDARDHDLGVVARLDALARSATLAIENARLLVASRATERQRALAVSAGRMGVWTLDVVTGAFETSAMCRINFGRDPKEDFTYADLRSAVHPDDQARVGQAIALSLTTGCDYDIEYRLITPSGETRWIGIRAQPTLAEDGSPLSIGGVSIDVTDRKRMEAALLDSAATLEHLVAERTSALEAAHEQLRQSQKLEAMGSLTGGVAHDFNNLLTPIVGALDLLQRRAVGGEREQRLIAGAAVSADRAKILVQRLLAFARRQPLQPIAVDLGRLVTNMAELVASTTGPQIKVMVDVAEGLPPAKADPNQVEMALLNLSVNARDAMPDGGTLRISATAHRVASGDAAGPRPGRYIRLAVTDTGMGMDEATLTRAIEPFFSTKGVGKGTGLGLSMVHGLASQLGGDLTLVSKPGLGTTVELWLPQSDEAPDMDKPARPHSLRGHGRVLLVDDEDTVRLSTAEMLGDLGYEVVEASTAEQALAMVEGGAAFNMIVTDHMMPGMSGADLARSIRERLSDLPVLIVSGYAEVEGIAPDLPRLTKPFLRDDLAAAISEIMVAEQD